MHLLKLMSELVSVSGYEETIRNYIKHCVKKNSPQIQIDRIGNLIIYKKGNT